MSRYIYLLLPLLFACQLTFSKQLLVCETCPITSIKEAIALADSGDVIVVKEGIYRERGLEINKPLSIIGENYPIIDGSIPVSLSDEDKNVGDAFRVFSDSVSIKGFKIRNIGHSYTNEYSAIYLFKSKHFTIVDNILENVFFGFLIQKSHHGVIKNNTISSVINDQLNLGNGIHLLHCSDILVEANQVSNLRDGIYFEFVSESTILGNQSHDNFRYGLHFMFSNNNVYSHNTFSNNGAGVAVMFSKFITMTKNTFKENWGTAAYGLLLKEINDAEIRDNVFEENTIAINTEGCSRINYTHNHFKRNGWAIKVVGACYANIFERNNFLYNAFDVSYNSKLNDNKFNNNYWSSYTGYDLNKDNIGDVPHSPIKLFSYIVNRTPETIVLLRSLFVDIINFSEKVSPVFTPENLVDEFPLMKVNE